MKQYIKILISLLSLIFFTACNNGFSELKRSSSNKLIDASGFHSNKRRPLYNKKYITKAKRNMKEMDYEPLEEDEEEYESLSPSSRNMLMYERMAKIEKRRKSNSRQRYYEDFYDDDIIESRRRMSDIDESESRKDLEQEIVEIKELLRKTKEEVTKAKCPYSARADREEEVALRKLKEKQVSKKPTKTKELEEELRAVEEDNHENLRKEPKPLKRKIMPLAEPGAMSHIKD